MSNLRRIRNRPFKKRGQNPLKGDAPQLRVLYCCYRDLRFCNYFGERPACLPPHERFTPPVSIVSTRLSPSRVIL